MSPERAEVTWIKVVGGALALVLVVFGVLAGLSKTDLLGSTLSSSIGGVRADVDETKVRLTKLEDARLASAREDGDKDRQQATLSADLTALRAATDALRTVTLQGDIDTREEWQRAIDAIVPKLQDKISVDSERIGRLEQAWSTERGQ